MGLTTAIYGPFIQGFMGGSAYNILGPAAALVNVLNRASAENGAEIIPITAIFGGVMGLFVFPFTYLPLFDEVERQVSVLEGFSVGVAVVIAFGQINFALGLRGLTRHPALAENLAESWEHVGEAKATEYISFLVFFVFLYCLNKIKPGVDENGKPKAKKPWLVFIALIGVVYGYVTSKFLPDIKPYLISDQYP